MSPSFNTISLRPGVQPNPKKDSSARRKRQPGWKPAVVDGKRDYKPTPVCRECRVKPRQSGSSRCSGCALKK